MKKYIYILLIFFSCTSQSEDMVFVPQNTYIWSLNEQNLFKKINKYRTDNNLSKLMSEDLHYDLAVNRNNENILLKYISHKDFPNTFKILIDSGLNWAGENLAYGYTTNESVMKAWIKSENHNKNILKPDWVYGAISINEHKNKKYYCLILSR